MSLENAISELNESVKALTTVYTRLLAHPPGDPAPEEEKETPAVEDKPVKTEKPKAKPTKGAKSAEEKPKGVGYDDVKRAILALVEVGDPEGRKAAKDILSEYGAKTGKDLEPGDYGAVVKDCAAALEKLGGKDDDE